MTDSLQTCGELGEGQTPSPEDASYCFTRLNSLLDSWSQDEDFIFTRTITTYGLKQGVFQYAIGPAAPAPFNTARPTKIDFARILIQVGGTYIGVKDLDIIPFERFVDISDKSATSIVPELLYYDNAFPLGNLYLRDTPSVVAPTQLELTVWSQLPQFGSLVAQFSFPPGYYEAIVLALAVAIGPAYNKPLDQVTAGRAAECIQRIKSINKMILRPGLPPAAYLPAPPAAGQSPQQQAAAQALQ